MSDILVERNRSIQTNPKNGSTPWKPRVCWEGTQFRHHSLAIVNRELCLALIATGECDLRILPYEPHEFGVEEDPVRFPPLTQRLIQRQEGPVDFHIRHHWPPNLAAPPSGRWIVMQPWESGSMPAAWLPTFRDTVDDVWVYSSYNRDCYIRDGISPEKIAVIPLAADFSRFKPELPPLPSLSEQTNGRFTFLFVGGTLWRKGIDILLKAYVETFDRSDKVLLVVKDMGGDSFYEGKTAEELILRIQSDPAAPEILYLRETLPEAVLPRLYASCNCLVHPYRGEGFGMPIAEAMACGLPAIIPKGGAADDFTTGDTVYYVPACQKSACIEIATVREASFLEPDRKALIQRMRHVAAHPDEAFSRGRRAAQEIRKRLGWEKSARIVLDRLSAMINIKQVVKGEQQMENNPLTDQITAGENLFLDGNVTGALNVFNNIIRKDPHNGAALNNSGVALNCLGRYKEAEKVFDELLRTNVQYPDAVYNSISNDISTGSWDKVQKCLNLYGKYLSSEQLEAITSTIEKLQQDMRILDRVEKEDVS